MESNVSISEGENGSKKISIETSEGYKFTVDVFGDSMYITNGFHNSLVITTVSEKVIKVQSGN